MIINDSEVVTIDTQTGPMRAIVSRPNAPGKYPGIVLYSEIFQITGPIKRTAAQVASQGFVVVTPEIYHEFEPAGTVLAYDEAGAVRGNALKTTKPLSGYDTDSRAALDFLKSYPHCTGKLGAMGICIGGHLAFRAAMNSDVLATTCFYPTDIPQTRAGGEGMNDNSLDRIPEIHGELLMIFGRQDPHVPREGRAIIYNALADADRNFQWHEFNAAHAFLRDEGPRYNPATAALCFGMAFELFKRRLGEGDVSENVQSIRRKPTLEGGYVVNGLYGVSTVDESAFSAVRSCSLARSTLEGVVEYPAFRSTGRVIAVTMARLGADIFSTHSISGAISTWLSNLTGLRLKRCDSDE